MRHHTHVSSELDQTQHWTTPASSGFFREHHSSTAPKRGDSLLNLNHSRATGGKPRGLVPLQPHHILNAPYKSTNHFALDETLLHMDDITQGDIRYIEGDLYVQGLPSLVELTGLIGKRVDHSNFLDERGLLLYDPLTDEALNEPCTFSYKHGIARKGVQRHIPVSRDVTAISRGPHDSMSDALVVRQLYCACSSNSSIGEEIEKLRRATTSPVISKTNIEKADGVMVRSVGIQHR